MSGKTEGFTIIEVMLFLAISGMLILMVMIGTGSMASRQRLTDTTDSLQAFFQTQYDEVVNGVNTRDTSIACPTDGGASMRPGASQRCLLLGKAIVIKDTRTLLAYNIISTQPLSAANTGIGVPDITKLQGVVLQASPGGMSSYELKWGASITGASRSTSLPAGSGRGDVTTIAFLRIPDSDRIVQLYYLYDVTNVSQGLSPAPTGYALTTDAVGAYNPAGSMSNPSLAVCVGNDLDFPIAKPRTAIYFVQGQGAGSITTNYQPGGLCPVI